MKRGKSDEMIKNQVEEQGEGGKAAIGKYRSGVLQGYEVYASLLTLNRRYSVYGIIESCQVIGQTNNLIMFFHYSLNSGLFSLKFPLHILGTFLLFVQFFAIWSIFQFQKL